MKSKYKFIILALFATFFIVHTVSASFYYSDRDWMDGFEDASINTTLWNTTTTTSGTCSGDQGTQSASVVEANDQVTISTQANCPAGGGSRFGSGKFFTDKNYNDGYNYRIVGSINGTITEGSGGDSAVQVYISYGGDGSTDVLLGELSEADIEILPINYTILINNTGAVFYRNGTFVSSNNLNTAVSWNVLYFASSSSNNAGSSNTDLNIYDYYSQTSNIIVNLTFPTSNQSVIQNNFNFSIEAPLFTGVNSTIFLWNSSGSIVNSTFIGGMGSHINSTSQNISNLNTSGTYKWNVFSCGINISSSSICSFPSANVTFFYGMMENQIVYNTTSFETAFESFIANVSSLFTITSANFWYNGTAYATTVTNPASSNYILTNSLDIPLGSGSRNFFWELISDTISINTTSNQQTVSQSYLTLCNSTISTTYLNISFKNETDSQQSVSAQISAIINYWLGGGTVYKTLSYVNTSSNPSYPFCFSPQQESLSTNLSMTYSNSESQQRAYNSNLDLTNTTTNKMLYLLPTSLGQYVTFQIINPAEQAISLATISINSTTFGEIESKNTDSSGGATFFLNPLISYTVTVVANGYDSTTVTITPTQTIYTIQLGGSSSDEQEDYSRGISYSILPSLASALSNNTNYSFNLTLTSTYWNLDRFGFSLTNASGYYLGSGNSTSSSGGVVNVNANTGNNTLVKINYYWLINGTYSNATAFWTVLDSSGDSWSIMVFFNDLRSYIDVGFFGMTNFSVSIIAFLVIFIFTGIFSYKYGLNSPTSIMALVLGLVLFFDVGLGIIPNPVGAVNYFPTIFVFLIFIGVFIKEVST